jgi:hypothetical protein
MAEARLRRVTERILSHLQEAENREPNPDFQDAFRLAWITVLHAARGEAQPFVSAHYRVYGLHPDKLRIAVEARRRAQLGPLYEFFYPESPFHFVGDLTALPPKKQVESVRFESGLRAKKNGTES